MSFELAPMASHNVIGFVGLDQLSLQLASSLLRFGYAVQAFETCSPLLDEFANQGGIRCASPVEVGKDVVALVVLISPADQINDLLFGHESALKGLRKDAVIILHSTILPAHIQKLEKRLTEDLERVFVVDIYVSKGMSEVLNGKIMIISSGQSDAITRACPILSESTFAIKIKGNATHVERSQSCHKMKVIAAKRPKNSASEVDLDFEHNVKPAPVITEGHFDDVQKAPSLPSKAPKEFKELDDNKSKKGLAEVHEEEYVQKTGLVSTALSFSDEQKKEIILYAELYGGGSS